MLPTSASGDGPASSATRCCALFGEDRTRGTLYQRPANCVDNCGLAKLPLQRVEPRRRWDLNRARKNCTAAAREGAPTPCRVPVSCLSCTRLTRPSYPPSHISFRRRSWKRSSWRRNHAGGPTATARSSTKCWIRNLRSFHAAGIVDARASHSLLSGRVTDSSPLACTCP
jgi:hypothetical protein